MTMKLKRFRKLDIQDLSLGEKTHGCLEIVRLPGNVLHVPILVARGRSAGPVLLAVAGVHGDEYEGMEAIREVFQKLDVSRMSGTFIGIPVCNMLAYDSLSRATPTFADGFNLARVFPGDADGKPTEALAYGLFQLAVDNLDESGLLVDLHSAGTHYRFLPVVSYRNIEGAARDRSIEAARLFGLPRLWADEPRPGRFTTELCKLGIPAIGGEMTGGGKCLAGDVKTYADGLMNSLGWLGIVEPSPEGTIDSQAEKVSLVYTAESGFLRLAKQLGDAVEEQENLGEVVDVFGTVRMEVRSPCSGYVLAIRSTPAILQGDAVAYIAYSDVELEAEI